MPRLRASPGSGVGAATRFSELTRETAPRAKKFRFVDSWRGSAACRWELRPRRVGTATPLKTGVAGNWGRRRTKFRFLEFAPREGRRGIYPGNMGIRGGGWIIFPCIFRQTNRVGIGVSLREDTLSFVIGFA